MCQKNVGKCDRTCGHNDLCSTGTAARTTTSILHPTFCLSRDLSPLPLTPCENACSGPGRTQSDFLFRTMPALASQHTSRLQHPKPFALKHTQAPLVSPSMLCIWGGLLHICGRTRVGVPPLPQILLLCSTFMDTLVLPPRLQDFQVFYTLPLFPVNLLGECQVVPLALRRECNPGREWFPSQGCVVEGRHSDGLKWAGLLCFPQKTKLYLADCVSSSGLGYGFLCRLPPVPEPLWSGQETQKICSLVSERIVILCVTDVWFPKKSPAVPHAN